MACSDEAVLSEKVTFSGITISEDFTAREKILCPFLIRVTRSSEKYPAYAIIPNISHISHE